MARISPCLSLVSIDREDLLGTAVEFLLLLTGTRFGLKIGSGKSLIQMKEAAKPGILQHIRSSEA